MSTERQTIDDQIDPTIVTDAATQKVTVYCITTCSTCKKAKAAIADAGMAIIDRDVRAKDMGFRDFEYLEGQVGWERLVNKSSQTWRNLDEADKTGLNRETALELLVRKPTLMKRPVIDMGSDVLVGWTAETRAKLGLPA